MTRLFVTLLEIMALKAGIYLHIPFCKRKCIYCNFHFSTNLNNIDALLHAIVEEMSRRSNEAAAYEVQSVYFGGGTPSLLSKSQWTLLFDSLRKYYSVDRVKEVTVEFNPEDVNPDIVQCLIDLGVNRWSLGVQSFYDDDLKWMNRAHTVRQSHKALELLLTTPLANVSVDLLYGLPNSNLRRWKENLRKIAQYNVRHLSCYALTVEEKTELHHKVKNRLLAMPEDNAFVEQMDYLFEWCKSNGYENYELSNAAKPGWRSLHNGSYWAGNPYIGFGPSAHSYDGKQRQWNIANNAEYIKRIAEGQKYYESELLTEVDRYNEYIMTRIRLMEGISLRQLSNGFGSYFDLRKKNFERWVQAGGLRILNGAYVLSDEGKHIADMITRDLFI